MVSVVAIIKLKRFCHSSPADIFTVWCGLGLSLAMPSECKLSRIHDDAIISPENYVQNSETLHVHQRHH